MKFKTKVLELPDHEYRDLPAFSYSLLKDLDESGPRSLTETSNKTGAALDFGSLVDILITSPERKDEVFWTKTLVKPTASLLELADALILDSIVMDVDFDHTIAYDNVTRKIKDLGLWSTMKDTAKIAEKWGNSLFFDYIRESIEAKGKIIVSPEVLENAEHCADVLLHHEYTSHFFVETEDIEVLKQASVLYKFKGAEGKARIDLLNIDHKNKIINIFDIKTGSELPTKFELSFYKYKYYLQVISYLLSIQYIVETDPDFKDYKIGNFKFLYISKKLPDVPVIYEVEEKLLNSFVDGWMSSTGEWVTGFMSLVDDYKFHSETGIYNTERRVIEKKGNMKLKLV